MVGLGTTTLVDNSLYFPLVIDSKTIKLFQNLNDYNAGINTVGFTTISKNGIHKFKLSKEQNTLKDIKVITWIKDEEILLYLVYAIDDNYNIQTAISIKSFAENTNTKINIYILHKNKNAFVRANPNFMYAQKNLYLPSIKEIKDLVYKNKDNLPNDVVNNTQTNKEIYFFGN